MNELFLGTYGQELLMYKERQRERSDPTTPPMVPADRDKREKKRDVVAERRDEEKKGEKKEEKEKEKEASDGKDFYLCWRMSFSQPILALHWIDLTHDGMNNLVVVTWAGVHVLQVTGRLVPFAISIFFSFSLYYFSLCSSPIFYHSLT